MDITVWEFFFIMPLVLGRIWRDNLPKYGRTIIKLLFGTVLTTGLGASTLPKNYLMHLSTNHAGSCFYIKYFLIYQSHDEI